MVWLIITAVFLIVWNLNLATASLDRMYPYWLFTSTVFQPIKILNRLCCSNGIFFFMFCWRCWIWQFLWRAKFRSKFYFGRHKWMPCYNKIIRYRKIMMISPECCNIVVLLVVFFICCDKHNFKKQFQWAHFAQIHHYMDHSIKYTTIVRSFDCSMQANRQHWSIKFGRRIIWKSSRTVHST